MLVSSLLGFEWPAVSASIADHDGSDCRQGRNGQKNGSAASGGYDADDADPPEQSRCEQPEARGVFGGWALP